NQHVVEGVNQAVVEFHPSQPVRTSIAIVVGRDPTNDLAVLKMVASLGGPGALQSPSLAAGQMPPLGDSSLLAKGQEVGALGFPGGALGHESTFTKGVVSATTAQVVQLDAALNPGNSGGPLITIKGEVVGVNFAKATSWYVPLEGLGFAVAINVAKENWERLKSGYFGVGDPETGMSVSQIRLTEEQQRQMGSSPQRYGLQVGSVWTGYGAKAAGLQAGDWLTGRKADIIVSYNGTPVQTFEELRKIELSLPVGTVVRVDYFRGNTLQSAWLVLLEKM
ncbi:MAG: S1C family serine protease, partial [Chloroflexota bacterium]|nr:S1C family serine protease [Chloroflexota bacterium]